MKVRTEIVEVEGEGLVSLLGKDVELFCGVYICLEILIPPSTRP